MSIEGDMVDENTLQGASTVTKSGIDLNGVVAIGRIVT